MHAGHRRPLAAGLRSSRRSSRALAAARAGRSPAPASAIALAVATLFLALFPHVMPSTLDPACSLTTTNASSTPYTLKIMTWVAVIFTPLVLLYQGWTYWVFRSGSASSTSRRERGDETPRPRLLRYARTTRVYLALSVALGTATAGLIIAQATLLADASGLPRGRRSPCPHADAAPLAVVAARALVVWSQAVAAHARRPR